MSAIDELRNEPLYCAEINAILGGSDPKIKQATLELADRLKALEEKAQLHGTHLVLLSKELLETTEPAPAPDLETLVEKYFGQLTKATFDINVPVMQAFKDILRAFAAELGVK